MIRMISSPLGMLYARCSGGAVSALSWEPVGDVQGEDPADARLMDALEQALSAYFSGSTQDFSLPVAPSGTDFEQTVWRALCTIPRGETRCYAEIAAAIGRPGAARAVGMACHRNPIAILIPCHRVVGRRGLTGYAGGLERKRALLSLESA